MSTTIVAASDVSDAPASLRLLPIAVNLLPEEIVTARINRSAQRLTVAVLLAVVIATGGWYYHVQQQTADASSQLAQAQDAATAAVRSQRAFTELKTTKSRITSLQGRLRQATAGDIAWSSLITELHKALPAHVTLTGITGSTAAKTQVGGAVAPPVADAPVGSLIISGEAPTKLTISAFVDRLKAVSGLSDANVTNVATDTQTKNLTFTINAGVTKKALSTRYSAKGAK